MDNHTPISLSEKRCPGCKRVKSLDAFFKDTRRQNGVTPRCRVCLLDADNARKDEIASYQDSYYKQNKAAIIARKRLYTQERIKRDPLYRIRIELRHRIRKAIKEGPKTGSAVRDLGCTIVELKAYLESKFQSGMTWDNWNRTGWHLDHIKPLISFDLSDPEQFRQAVHYTNLQPLWASDNLKKGRSL